ncbi:MAG: glycogen synthase [Candidatus Izemoplasmataceae bacterium]
MKILFVGSEATPFCKSGGLGDVLGSLPRALKDLGHEVSLVLPKHLRTKEVYDSEMKTLGTARIPVHTKHEYAGFQHLSHEGLDVYFIDNEYYFGYRENMYGDFDDGERYAYFNHAVLSMVKTLDLSFDVIHLNDWPSGLIPFIIKKENPLSYTPATVFTIHNLAYQGQFDKGLIPYLNLDYDQRLEYDHGVNFLKTALVTADLVSTVSESYAEEITYAYFGYGMEQILRDRHDSVHGVINGLDYDVFNPSKDPNIPKPFDLYNHVKGKEWNKVMLMERFDMPASKKPLYGVVSRLVEHKGIPVLLNAIEPFIANDSIRLVVLGSGDEDYENAFRDLKARYPERVGIYFGYNDSLARQVYAGSEFFLMPSRYEPCGLAQMIAMRYGSIPIVRQTGGLKDTVTPYNKYTGEGNGLGFLNYDAEDLKRTLQASLDLYASKTAFKSVRRSAMKKRFTWEKSAMRYETLYKSIIRS